MGSSPSHAKILLDRKALHYAAKAKNGKPLSPSEIAMLECIIAGGTRWETVDGKPG